jgi:hypothetical protein
MYKKLSVLSPAIGVLWWVVDAITSLCMPGTVFAHVVIITTP